MIDTLLPETTAGRMALLEQMQTKLPDDYSIEPYGDEHWSVFHFRRGVETELTPMPLELDKVLYFLTGLLARGAK
jgi:hypothetical protein